MDAYVILLQLFATFLFSFLFGFERQRAHKPVGFGTYVFVATGACALAIAGTILAPGNSLPLLGSIITGIGFLGAGALIRTSDKIFGFMSAAAIWLFAIFGLLIGTGQYFIAGIVYAIVWLVVLYDLRLECRGVGSYQRRLVLTTNRIINQKEVKTMLLLATKNHKLISVEIDKGGKKLTFIYLIEGGKEAINAIPEKLYEKEWLESCKIE